MNATLSLTTPTTFHSHTETRPAIGLLSALGVKVPRVVIRLSLVLFVQACVVLLVIGAAWAGIF
jgi:hypothetical protein